MKSILRAAGYLAAAVLPPGGLLVYYSFHEPGSWISRSPSNSSWAVDLIPSGFVDVDQDFRVHDLAVSALRPRYVCDVYWEELYSPTELRWSQDGSVAAIVIDFHKYPKPLFACAYDFRKHQAMRTGNQSSPLVPSAEFSASIELLLSERGGIGAAVPIPDVTKGP